MSVGYMFLGYQIYNGGSMSIQFKHVRDFFNTNNGGVTVAVDLGDSNLSTLNIDESINTVKVGVAICSEKDSFQKKVGRELSTSRLKTLDLKVTKVSKSKLPSGNILSIVVLESDTIYLKFTQSSKAGNFRLDSVSAIS